MGPRIDSRVHAVKIDREVMASHGRHRKSDSNQRSKSPFCIAVWYFVYFRDHHHKFNPRYVVYSS